MASDQTHTAFVIELEDETSGPALEAAGALDKLKAKIDADTKALKAMQAAQRNLKGSTLANSAAAKDLKAKIEAQKSTIASSQAKFLELGGAFGETSAKSATVKTKFADLLGVAKKMPGPLGGVASKLGMLGELLAGGVIAAGIFAIVAALAALVAGVAVATAALLRYGIAQADARRAEELHLEGLTRLRSRFGIAAGSASELQAAIDRVSASSALGRQQIGGMAEQLYRAGLRGAALRESLEALAIVESTQGAAGVAQMRGRIIADARAGRSAQRLADTQRRLGDIARRQLLSLNVQSEKLRESFGHLFDALQLEGFLGGLHQVFDLFSQTTATGRALKAMLTTLFQPMIDGIAAVGPIAKRFFQGMVIAALILGITLLRIRNWLRQTFGDSTILGNINALDVALYAGIAVFGAFTAALALAVVVIGAVAASFAFLLIPLAAVVAAVVGVVLAVREAVDFFQRTDWSGLARGLIDGLVNGIRAGATRVATEVRSLASTATTTLQQALGIRSPSRVFAELGVQIPRGLAQGVDTGAPIAASAVEGLGQPGPGASPQTSSRALGGSVVIEQLHVHAQSSDPQDLAERLEAEIVRVLQGAAEELGAPA